MRERAELLTEKLALKDQERTCLLVRNGQLYGRFKNPKGVTSGSRWREPAVMK